jgi:hypothetical protein
MAILFSDNLNIGFPKPIDNRYFGRGGSATGLQPWATIGDVNANIPETRRYTGLTVNIMGDEYWYASGITDTDLVLKTRAVPDAGDNDVLHNHVYMWTGTTAEDGPLFLNEWYDNTQSAGRLTGGEITVNNEDVGTVSVAAGTGIIKLEGSGEQFSPDPNFNNDRNAINKYVEWNAVPSLQLIAGYNFVYYDAND